jgi:hypothetical protein
MSPHLPIAFLVGLAVLLATHDPHATTPYLLFAAAFALALRNVTLAR